MELYWGGEAAFLKITKKRKEFGRQGRTLGHKKNPQEVAKNYHANSWRGGGPSGVQEKEKGVRERKNGGARSDMERDDGWSWKGSSFRTPMETTDAGNHLTLRYKSHRG